MKVLVACEFSGTVRDAFTARGHDAISCDILPTDTPGKHYQGDVRDILNDNWDLVIAHPPCTDLASSGARHFAAKQADGRQQKSIEFFMIFTSLSCKVAIENPIGIMSNLYRKPSQIIHPYHFGHNTSKATCLWLHNLPPLTPTNIVDKGETVSFPSGTKMSKWYYDTGCLPVNVRKHVRSITFQGIANAMANQWG